MTEYSNQEIREFHNKVFSLVEYSQKTVQSDLIQKSDPKLITAQDSQGLNLLMKIARGDYFVQPNNVIYILFKDPDNIKSDLREDIDLSLRSKKSKTSALGFSIKNSKYTLFRLLLTKMTEKSYEALPDQDENGNTDLILALKEGDFHSALRLAEKMSFVGQYNKEGETATKIVEEKTKALELQDAWQIVREKFNRLSKKNHLIKPKLKLLKKIAENINSKQIIIPQNKLNFKQKQQMKR